MTFNYRSTTCCEAYENLQEAYRAEQVARIKAERRAEIKNIKHAAKRERGDSQNKQAHPNQCTLSGKKEIIGSQMTPRVIGPDNGGRVSAPHEPRVIPVDDDDEHQDGQSSQMSFE